MKVRIALLALASILLVTDGVQAQRFRGGRGGDYGRGGYYNGGYYNGGFGNGFTNGLGYGLGSGIGYGIGSGYYGGYNGYSSPYYYGGYNGYRSPYYGGYATPYYGTYDPGYSYPSTTSAYQPSQNYVPSSTNVVPASATSSIPDGMLITEITDGPAKSSRLREGDVITAVGSTKTLTFEELQKALARSNDKMEVSFINGANMKTEKVMLTPNNGKIGVTVIPAYRR